MFHQLSKTLHYLAGGARVPLKCDPAGFRPFHATLQRYISEHVD